MGRGGISRFVDHYEVSECPNPDAMQEGKRGWTLLGVVRWGPPRFAHLDLGGESAVPSNRDHIDSPGALSLRTFSPQTVSQLVRFHFSAPDLFVYPFSKRGDSSDCGGMSTPGHGQGEGPDGDKWSTDHAGHVGRGRSERSERSPPQSLLSFRFK